MEIIFICGPSEPQIEYMNHNIERLSFTTIKDILFSEVMMILVPMVLFQKSTHLKCYNK